MNMGGGVGAQWRSDTDKGESKEWGKILFDPHCSQLVNATHIRYIYMCVCVYHFSPYHTETNRLMVLRDEKVVFCKNKYGKL